MVTITAFSHGSTGPKAGVCAQTGAVSIESAIGGVVHAAAQIAGGARGTDHPHTGIFDALPLHTSKATVAAHVITGVIDALALSADSREGAGHPSAGRLAALPINTKRPFRTPTGTTVIEADAIPAPLVWSTACVETEIRHAGAVATNLAVWAPVGSMAIVWQAPAEAAIGGLGTRNTHAGIGTASVLTHPAAGAVSRPTRRDTVAINTDAASETLVDLAGIGALAVPTGVIIPAQAVSFVDGAVAVVVDIVAGLDPSGPTVAARVVRAFVDLGVAVVVLGVAHLSRRRLLALTDEATIETYDDPSAAQTFVYAAHRADVRQVLVRSSIAVVIEPIAQLTGNLTAATALITDPLVHAPIAVVVELVTDLGDRVTITARALLGVFIDLVVAVIVDAITDLRRLGAAFTARVEAPFVDPTVAILVDAVTALLGHGPAFTAGVLDALVHRVVTVVVDFITDLGRLFPTGATSIQRALIDLAVTVVIGAVAHLRAGIAGLRGTLEAFAVGRTHQHPLATTGTDPLVAGVPQKGEVLIDVVVAIIVDAVAGLPQTGVLHGLGQHPTEGLGVGGLVGGPVHQIETPLGFPRGAAGAGHVIKLRREPGAAPKAADEGANIILSPHHAQLSEAVCLGHQLSANLLAVGGIVGVSIGTLLIHVSEQEDVIGPALSEGIVCQDLTHRAGGGVHGRREGGEPVGTELFVDGVILATIHPAQH